MKLNIFLSTNHRFQGDGFLTGFSRRHPGGSQEAARRHPPEVFPPSPSDDWDLILCKPLHKFTFGYNFVYIFYLKLEPDPLKRDPWDDPGAPPASSTKKPQKNHSWRTPNMQKTYQTYIQKHIKNKECFLRVPEHDILSFLMISDHVRNLIFTICCKTN